MRWLSDESLERLRVAADQPAIPGGRYEILAPLARGGMGVVWRARDRELARDVAVKVLDLPMVDDAARERMLREARILAKLEHPGIVPVHDVGTLADGRTWYAMKLVEGSRLGEAVRSEPHLAARLRLFQRICEAVAFAHARGVIHRDLKPDNVMVGSFGEVLVMDWGVAKMFEESSAPSPGDATVRIEGAHEAPGTRPGAVLGTPGWMSPEQASGHSGDVDPRSDVYSLGKILSSLADTAVEPPPHRLRAVVQRATAETREARYGSVEALADDVARLLAGESVSAHRDTLFERAGRIARRHSTALLLLAVYLVVRMLLLLFARV